MPQLRNPNIEVTAFYCIAYGLVFLLGMIGNIFVIMALIRNPTLRNVTNYFIASLAAADLLICIFVVPLTLMNNIIVDHLRIYFDDLRIDGKQNCGLMVVSHEDGGYENEKEWLFGDFVCKAQVWLSGTCVCASVYILVAVSADRFMAICYPIRYSVWSSQHGVLWIIVVVWVVAGLAFTPWYLYFGTWEYRPQLGHNATNVTYPNASYSNNSFILCMPNWPSRLMEITVYIVLNVTIAFLIPLVAIVVLYTFIFRAIFNRKSIAVDNQATMRETRLRVRVTHMMLAVVVTFVICWVPIYALFAFIMYKGQHYNSPVVDVARPVFQWLSLANSCFNPLLYASFSAKFRLAFLEIIVLPCRRRYGTFRRFTQTTIRRISDKRTISVSSKVSISRGNPRRRQGNRRCSPQVQALTPDQSCGCSVNSVNGRSETSCQPLMMRSFSNYLIINERYVDDGNMVSIPLFEKISAV